MYLYLKNLENQSYCVYDFNLWKPYSYQAESLGSVEHTVGTTGHQHFIILNKG